MRWPGALQPGPDRPGEEPVQSPLPYTIRKQTLSNNDTDLRVLVVWDRPAQFADNLSRRFPGVHFEYAASLEAVNAALERIRPQIVFSIKDQRIPMECHRAAARHPGVKWIQVGGSGYEHLGAVDPSAVTVTNAAGVLARFLAETVTGVMLAWNVNLYRYRDQQRERTWEPVPFSPLCDKTLLVVGTGAIGRRVAANARALGMRVLGANRTPTECGDIDAMFTLDNVEEALARADFVSVHLRLNDQTEHFIDRDRLWQAKPGAFFMNTSRGAVVDTGALVDSLRAGRLSGAYLDVFEEEPLPAEHVLWTMDNVLITPHAADQVEDWPARFAGFFAGNLQRWIDAEPLRNVVAGASGPATDNDRGGDA